MLCAILGVVLVLMPLVGLPQEPERKHIPISIEDILRQQAVGNASKGSPDLNERLRSMAAMSRYSQDYLLGPADIIEVTVFGIEDLKKKELTLDSEGKVSLPFINDVQLMGLTPRESEVKIATLFEASVMKHPQVGVSVKEYKSQFINILGSVFKPGTYQLTRRAFLVDALAMAGGLTDKADSRCLIHRSSILPARPTPLGTSDATAATQIGEAAQLPDSSEVHTVDLLQLLEGDVSLNVPVYAGDVISIPERQEKYFYVLGDVHKAGAFEIRKNERVTLSKALATAGGLLGTASGRKTTIMRQNPDGVSTTQIDTDAIAVMKGKI